MNTSPQRTANPPATTTPPTPLTTAHILYTDLFATTPTSLTTFTDMLTHLTTTSYLLTSDLTNRQPLHSSPPILFAARQITDATHTYCTSTSPHHRIRFIAIIHIATLAMLTALLAEKARYETNLARLYAAAVSKMRHITNTSSMTSVALRLGKSGVDAMMALRDSVSAEDGTDHDMSKEEQEEEGGAYLGEIARYWRRWAGTQEARKYEEVWGFVAGRVLVQE